MNIYLYHDPKGYMYYWLFKFHVKNTLKFLNKKFVKLTQKQAYCLVDQM